MNEKIILTALCQRFKIDLNEAEEEMKKINEKELLENQHPYKIWEGKNGSWYTHLPPDRKLLRKSSREKLLDALRAFYLEDQSSPTVEQVFDSWLAEKLSKNEIQKGSADRYQTDFVRFFKKSRFSEKKISSIDEKKLETFIREQIALHKLSQKTYAGLRTLVRGIWKKAKKDGFTNISISEFFGDLDLSRNVFCKKVVERENEVFSEEELPYLTSYLTREEASIWDLGVALVFETGLRVGELATLKRTDWDQRCVLKVRRSECRFKDESGKNILTVKNFTKTDAGMRDVLLSSQAQIILARIIALNPKGKFLFENQTGKRIRGNSFNAHLDTVLCQLGMHHRSIHKARKTYGTRLIDGGCEDSLVMQQLGHTSIETTRKYYYFANSVRKHQLEQVQKALI